MATSPSCVGNKIATKSGTLVWHMLSLGPWGSLRKAYLMRSSHHLEIVTSSLTSDGSATRRQMRELLASYPELCSGPHRLVEWIHVRNYIHRNGGWKSRSSGQTKTSL
jgi:hypothetical protein